MKKFLKYLCVIRLLFSSIILFPQLPVTQLLKQGDSMPDIELSNMYNYPLKKLNLSNLKDKLIILDLWNMTCGPCIKGFPNLEKLQEKYGESIQIILVNPLDSKEFLKNSGFPGNTKSTILSKTKLPIAIDEAKFLKLFSINGMPYQVWINNGIIAGLTTGSSVTTDQINNLLEGKGFQGSSNISMEDLGLVDDAISNSNSSVLQLKSKILADNLLFSFIIAKNIGGKGFAGLIYDSASNKIIGLRNSHTLIHLIADCFDDFNIYQNPDKIVLEVENPETYIYPRSLTDEQKTKWNKENVYSYEIKLPLTKMTGVAPSDFLLIREIILRELELYFGIKASIEKRRVKCRILVKKSKEERLSTNAENYYYQPYGSIGDEGILFQKGNINLLTEEIRQALVSYPVMPFLNETGIPESKQFDITINSSLKNVIKLKEALLPYGLDIIEEYRELTMLVIKEQKGNFDKK